MSLVESTNTTSPTPEPSNNNLDAPTTAVRKRTRATAEQLSVLEDTFSANVSPNSKLRKELSERLQMSERSIQIWFQNRRAKVKHMQKRAQMQMQQASIRAQLYHYHQQQYGMQPYGGTPIMPLPQHHQQMYPRVPLPRSSSVDSSSIHHPSSSLSSMSTPPASSTSSTTSSSSPSASLDSLTSSANIPPSHHLSYPLQDNVDFPDYLHGNPLSPSPSPHHHDYSSTCLSYPSVSAASPTSSIPTLVAVPDAGPTAMLTTSSSTSSSSSSISTTSSAITPPDQLDQATVSPQDIWPSSAHHATRSQSVSVLYAKNGTCSDLPTPHPVERSLSNPPVTIDPSNLMMNKNNNDNTIPTSPHISPSDITTTTTTTTTIENNGLSDMISMDASSDVYLNCTTLTIGTWHRLKLRVSDLLCVFKNNVFEWQIEDAGCHFKMEIPLSSVAGIEFVEDNNVLADVHFDISESPLFYMETGSSENTSWVQCSDFTEGKQASRFFRHSLKGVSQHLKQDLMTLIEKCPETRRWVRFVEPTQHYPSSNYYQPSSHYIGHPLQDPMMMSSSSPTNMAFASYIPPPNPSSYWSSMYPSTPIMMGVSNYLV
ncbi:uncharacterized protein BX664DRAFT_340529 [Halteromyces radiatus]|uniref:uncharacterized protein n=1 Tax=Halteromyces radiatus TaxID=101107 RepID=UPI00221F036D|nr:uncharacterized protein BX664DRAFT_340529 [Halteromyces radiatus]KAI8081493.1 hypothetical protein BX664DRAFT_340529 [Halteromyces radiatus]